MTGARALALAAALSWSVLVAGCEGGPAPLAGDPTARVDGGASHDGATDAAAWGAADAGESDMPDADPGARVHLPDHDGPFAPALVRLARGNEAGGDVPARLADVSLCAGCHADVVAQWKASAHASAALDNPYYRVAFDAVREREGRRASRQCAGCHEPALLLAGGIDQPIRTDDPLAVTGVTCLVCHGIVDARADGNASFTLRTDPIPIPKPGDAESIRRHRARLAPNVLRTRALCGSCHRSFADASVGVPSHLAGLTEPDAFRRSAFDGSRASRVDAKVDRRDCRGCHMPSELAERGDMAALDGTVRSHRFAGGHSALAAARGDTAQLAAVRRRLEGVVGVDVSAVVDARGRATVPADGAAITRGSTLTLEVTVRNDGVGHRFPGGTRDLADTWVELTVSDTHGTPIAEAGTGHAGGDDRTAFVLRSAVLDARGRPERLHRVDRFRAGAWDHTIAPRDVQVVRYTLRVPRGLPADAEPLRVEARLRHRRHDRALRQAACAASRSARGRAFAETAKTLDRPPIDGCVQEPVTDLARAVVWLGRGAGAHRDEGGADRPAWRRAWDLGRGLGHDVQERLAEADTAAVRAHVLLARDGAGAGVDRLTAEAMIDATRAAIAARRGRTAEALALAARAEARIGPHPALDRIRGQALARVFRFRDAAPFFARAAAAAPGTTASSAAVGGARQPGRGPAGPRGRRGRPRPGAA